MHNLPVGHRNLGHYIFNQAACFFGSRLYFSMQRILDTTVGGCIPSGIYRQLLWQSRTLQVHKVELVRREVIQNLHPDLYIRRSLLDHKPHVVFYFSGLYLLVYLVFSSQVKL